MAHYFDSIPETPSQPQHISWRFRGIDFAFQTDHDVFSKRQIDFGTDLLLQAVAEELSSSKIKTGKLLDLGCGYGVVGITMKRILPALDVTMVDINQRAITLAGINAKDNHTKFVEILISNGWENIPRVTRFDFVLTNPPVRAGKKVVFDFYQGAFEQLDCGGYLYVVLQKKQGAPSSQKFLTELFGNCAIIRKDAGYYIMRSRKE